jgi:small subunit ribosomal protein S21
MNKKQKEHQTIMPGNGMAIRVVENDISYALKTWKYKFKQTGIMDQLKSKKEFEKPSITRRSQIQRASYIQRIKSLNNK